MITLRQRSGQTVILGTKAEKTIVEALAYLHSDVVKDDATKANYIQSLITELSK